VSAMPNLFPALDGATEAALRESIRRFGVLVPVVRDQHGNTLDGFHRSRIATEENVRFRVDLVTVADEDEAREIARTLNADRRQMTPEQRREVVAALREAGHSLRAIGGAVGVSKDQVAKDLGQLSTSRQLNEPERVQRNGPREW
jgi:ParB-like chromosome segregation protein Spo0J